MLPIIIVNWNGLEDTIECIDSVMNSTYQDFRIYLIDNNSNNQDAVKATFENHSKLELILHQQNHGFAKAHNLIWDSLKTDPTIECIFLLNNDTVISKHCLQNLLNQFENEGDLISCKMIDYYQRMTLDNVGHKVLTSGEVVPIGVDAPTQNFNNTFRNVGPSGGAALYSTKCLRDLGMFDPYFETGYEDAELGLRAVRAGYSCTYCPDAVVYHKGGRSIKKVFDSAYAVKTQKNILYTFYKLFPGIHTLIYTPIILLKNFFAFVLSLLFFRWKMAGVILKSTIGFFLSDFGKALKARRLFSKDRDKLGWTRFLSLCNSFLTFDIKRAKDFLLHGKRSSLEKYR